MLTAQQLRRIAGPRARNDIIVPVADAFAEYLPLFGLDQPWRLTHFIAQAAHESDRFHTTHEYASGAAYEGRRDLGNTRRGDGRRFRGHGLFQLTGRRNHRVATVEVRKHIPDFPYDFEAEPERAAEPALSLLIACLYWESINPTRRSLNRYADRNDIEMITRRINGGLNGYDDRVHLYTRTALVMLGYGASDVRGFQAAAGLMVDGIAGPRTRTALHAALKAA